MHSNFLMSYEDVKILELISYLRMFAEIVRKMRKNGAPKTKIEPYLAGIRIRAKELKELINATD